MSQKLEVGQYSLDGSILRGPCNCSSGEGHLSHSYFLTEQELQAVLGGFNNVGYGDPFKDAVLSARLKKRQADVFHTSNGMHTPGARQS
jgi:hypothetical protein